MGPDVQGCHYSNLLLNEGFLAYFFSLKKDAGLRLCWLEKWEVCKSLLESPGLCVHLPWSPFHSGRSVCGQLSGFLR